MEKDNNNEKKGLLGRLIKVTKPKKGSCCSFEIEEIPECDDKKEKQSDKNGDNNCCN
ncbi:MAG: hypothetical protein PHZ11_10990 [Desulfitobacteriaceae bacterium]|nr:hypothetical protein [Desulfitobacteriaceae bacterium]